MKKLVVIAALATSSQAYGQAPTWAAGVIAGFSSLVSAAGMVMTWFTDYESFVINTEPNSYSADHYTSYTAGGQTYHQVWTAGEVMGGGFAFTHTTDGTGLTTIVDHNPFIIGTPSLPLATQQWTCQGATYYASQSSTAGFKSTYTVTRPAMYRVPYGSNFTVRLVGEELPATCVPNSGVTSVSAVSKYVMRGQSTRWKLEKVNYAVSDWMSIAQ